MTEWVLITMICMRNCVPDYVTIFKTKQECVAQLPKLESNWGQRTKYCVPLIKE